MYNEELYQKLADEFPAVAIRNYCLMTSRMYNHMYEQCSTDVCNEFDYQRQWWLNKYLELTTLLKKEK